MIDMRPTLTPRELGISKLEYEALLWTRDLLASGQAQSDPDEELEHDYGFNMNVYENSDDGCGTTCCIGGWMFQYMKSRAAEPSKSAASYVLTDRSVSLTPLFFPFTTANGKEYFDDDGQSYDFPLDLMAPSQGLTAINNFLATGAPNWPAAVGLE